MASGGHCRVYNTEAFRELMYDAEMEKIRSEAELRGEGKDGGGGADDAGEGKDGMGASKSMGGGVGGGSRSTLGRGAGVSRLDGGPTMVSNQSSRRSLDAGRSTGSLRGRAGADERAAREQARLDMKARRFKDMQAQRDAEDRVQKNERMKELHKKKERTFKYWMSRVNDPKEREMVEKVHNWLDLNEDESKRKLRAMHLDWEENVYGAISNDILRQMEARNPAKTKRRIRQEYQNYIDLTNKKGTIFRDIFVESEYDPNVLNRHTIKANKPENFDDPTDRVLRKRKEEIGMMSGGWVAKADANGGRETLDVEDWATGKIESTPHGFAARFGVPPPTISDMQKKLSRSNVVMDQFHILTGDLGKAKLMEELGPGKKPVPGKRPDHKLW